MIGSSMFETEVLVALRELTQGPPTRDRLADALMRISDALGARTGHHELLSYHLEEGTHGHRLRYPSLTIRSRNRF